MVSKHLSVVPGSPEGSEIYDLGRGPETTADRVKRLQHEARLLAREEVEMLETKMAEMAAMAATVAEGGEAYPAGIRELCSRLVVDTEQRAQTLKALVERTFGE